MRLLKTILTSLILTVGFTERARAFGSFEHIWLGEGPMLQFPDDNLDDGDQIFAEDYPYRDFIAPIAALFDTGEIQPQFLRIGNLKLSPGEIVAIAGDYFALVGSTISDAEPKNIYLSPELRFLYAFTSFIESELGFTRETNSEEIKQLKNEPGKSQNATPLHNEILIQHIAKLGHFIPWDLRYEDYDNVDNPFKPEKSLKLLRETFKSEFINLIDSEPLFAGHKGKIQISLEKIKEEVEKRLERLRRFPETLLPQFKDIHTLLVEKKSLWGLIKETFNWNNPPYYTQILQENFDHFGTDALQVYDIGHRWAVKVALYAANQEDPKEKRKWLNIAYAINAFASHYLSDLFSAGHLRTPRSEIFKQSYNSSTAGLAANAMHDEDGYYGLEVENQRGDQWTAFGDYSYFSPRSRQNRLQIQKCLNASFAHIYQVFITGTRILPDETPGLIPKAKTVGNFSPLFKVNDAGFVLVRNSYDDLETNSYSLPSLITWLRSWFFKPHWKKSSKDFRWLINKAKPDQSRLMEFTCHRDSFDEGAVVKIAHGIYLDPKDAEVANSKILFSAKNPDLNIIIRKDDIDSAKYSCLTAGLANNAFSPELRLSPYNPSGDKVAQVNGSMMMINQNNGSIEKVEFPMSLR